MVEVPFIHPGKHLAEILEEQGVSPASFAELVDVDSDYLVGIIEARLPITPDVAAKIGKELDMSPEFWLRQQARYNLEGKVKRRLKFSQLPSPSLSERHKFTT